MTNESDSDNPCSCSCHCLYCNSRYHKAKLAVLFRQQTDGDWRLINLKNGSTTQEDLGKILEGDKDLVRCEKIVDIEKTLNLDPDNDNLVVIALVKAPWGLKAGNIK